MSLKRSIKLFGKEAEEAAWIELEQLFVKKQAMVPIARDKLSYKKVKQIIGSSLFLKAKFDASGAFDKLKARLVAWGNQQNREDYPDRSAPTVALQNVMTTISIAAREKRKLATFDIGSAYLCCDLVGEEVIIELDKLTTAIVTAKLPDIIPFVDEKDRLVCRLDKSLYGLVQSARNWYDKFTGELKKIGFVVNEEDPCVFNKIVRGKQLTVVIFVDDIIATCCDEGVFDELFSQLTAVFKEVKMHKGNELSYLGMRIVRKSDCINVSMDGYINKFLDDYKDVKVVNTPANEHIFAVSKSNLLNETERMKFHGSVAKLLYLSLRVKLGIVTPVSFLCTRVTRATEEDLSKLMRVVGYLKKTANTGVVFRGQGEMKLEGYIDAAFGCHDDGKSHTGLVIMLGSDCIVSKSTKQKIVTKDSTEAEIVAASDKVDSLLDCCDFLREQGYTMPTPTLYQDNLSAITIMKKGLGKDRNPYLKTRKFLMKQKLEDELFKFEYVPTKSMKADINTKPLQGNLFNTMLNTIDNVEYATN